MSSTREIVREFFEVLCAGDFEGGFARMTDDATWSIIGKTAISGTLDKAGIIEKQLPMLQSFKEGPIMTVDEIIADGDRAVVVAHCTGIGPTGPYNQDSYAFVMKLRDGKIASVTEYLDTVQVETGICGNKLVPANGGN